MAGIETQTDERWIGPLHECVYLARRLHKAGAVMMEYRAQACLVAYGSSNTLDTFRRHVPLAPGEAQGWLNAAGRIGACGICRRLVGQHDDRPPSVTDRGEQSRGLDRSL